ncbi:MAG: haloacid dehalogenase-like hydrolase [Alphaproteobacteria bacterium]|nr:haloacid dehalogenase-like hydrolase [Alphaproteobacteria bacterium]
MSNNSDKKPICVDLDGTLIKNDVTVSSLKVFLKQNIFRIFKVLLWLIRGRAYLKRRLAQEVEFDTSWLIYNEKFLDFLISKQQAGIPIFLATASDEIYAKKVAEQLGIFDGIFASNGEINLRAKTKADTLCILFGEGGFIYAGNSKDDLAVWRKSGGCILVSPSKAALKGMSNKQYILFE